MCLDLVKMGYDDYVRDQAVRLGFHPAYVAAHPAELERFLAVRLADPPPLEIYLRHVIGRQAFDLGARIKDIKVPTLVLVGDDEDHGGAGHMTHFTYAKALANDIPDARLVVLPGQGHYYYYSDPQATNAAIRNFIAAG
jgi:pimeloyl-ACP methyl ester carboxylesterase